MCNTLVYKWLYFTWSINNAALARAAVSLAGKHTIYERPEYTIESLTNEKHQQTNILLAGALNLNQISLDFIPLWSFSHCRASCLRSISPDPELASIELAEADDLTSTWMRLQTGYWVYLNRGDPLQMSPTAIRS